MNFRSHIFGAGKHLSTEKHSYTTSESVCMAIRDTVRYLQQTDHLSDVWADVYIVAADGSEVFLKTIDLNDRQDTPRPSSVKRAEPVKLTADVGEILFDHFESLDNRTFEQAVRAALGCTDSRIQSLGYDVGRSRSPRDPWGNGGKPSGA